MLQTAKMKKVQKEDVPPPISTIDTKTVLNNVFEILGKPRNLIGPSPSFTRATAIHQNAFRVSIYTKTYLPGIAHSFFVIVDEDGKILSSYPEIVKHYE